MKVLIQGLGEVPATIEFAFEKEKPKVTYIICSEYQLRNIAYAAGYTEPNETIVRRAAERSNSEVIFKLCDVFDPSSVCASISEILRELKPADEIVINYTGGAANVKLFLGATAVALSSFLHVRIIYAIRYKDGTEIFKDYTDDIKGIFKKLFEFF
ncbi:MAG: hypothetical protein QMD95_03890 [Candidatus Hodarchaeaceae archaeon]|nr:hypothetical protein [Candidatus Hodarchaeaceae archaeon]